MTTATEEDRRRHRNHSRNMHRGVARVLVAEDNPACRLTLQTVLEAGGYRVDSAASAAEAVSLLDQCEYALVLSDLVMESPEAGLQVIAHARTKPYRPATAIVTTSGKTDAGESGSKYLVAPENLPEFLGEVAGLISARASRRVARTMRRAS